MTESSTQGIKTVLVPVSDLETAKAVYGALLGVSPQTDSSYYVGFDAEGQQIGLVPGGGPQGMTSPVPKNSLASATGMASTSLMSRPPRWYSSTDASNRFPSHSSQVVATPAIIARSV